MSTDQNVDAVLRSAARRLADAGKACAMSDARRLMAFTLGVEVSRLAILRGDPIADEHRRQFDQLVARRGQGVPTSKLIGTREFYGRCFTISDAVLDPRPDTETLVESALTVEFDTVLDLGTGSGCILLTLLAQRPSATGVGIDLSSDALAIAAQNAQAFGVEARAHLALSDWWQNVSGSYDLIVSNPPYIALEEMADLQVEVREHDPRMALTDEGDGLSAYLTIVAGAGAHLKPSGWLMVEIGPSQGRAVAGFFTAAGFRNCSVLPDIDGRDRVVRGQWQG